MTRERFAGRPGAQRLHALFAGVALGACTASRPAPPPTAPPQAQPLPSGVEAALAEQGATEQNVRRIVLAGARCSDVAGHSYASTSRGAVTRFFDALRLCTESAGDVAIAKPVEVSLFTRPGDVWTAKLWLDRVGTTEFPGQVRAHDCVDLAELAHEFLTSESAAIDRDLTPVPLQELLDDLAPRFAAARQATSLPYFDSGPTPEPCALLGLSRDRIREAFGEPSFCRRGPLPTDSNIVDYASPDCSGDRWSYALYRTPPGRLGGGGGLVLKLSFDAIGRCSEAHWIASQ